MDLTKHELLRLWADAAVEGMPDVRSDGKAIGDVLASRAIDRSARHPSWSSHQTAGISPLDAFIETAAEFGSLLDNLEASDWTRRTRLEGTTIRDVVEHLVGMERYVLGQLGLDTAFEADRREDHWPVTRAASADITRLSNTEAARTWWQEVLRVVAACAERDSEDLVRYHHLAGGVHTLLVSRTFELWAHGDDVRQALGLPLNLLDEARLTLMVSELMGAFSAAMTLAGQSLPGRSARFELEGPGGGSFDVALSLGEQPADRADIVISTTVIGLCRLAANRMGVEELDVDSSGDTSLLHPVLLATGAFAAD